MARTLNLYPFYLKHMSSKLINLFNKAGAVYHSHFLTFINIDELTRVDIGHHADITSYIALYLSRVTNTFSVNPLFPPPANTCS